MSDPDRKLARKAGRGDRQALTELYDRYRSRIYGYLRRALRDPATAEDVFQEVWIKVMNGIDRYEPRRSTFRAWLFRVAANAAVDRVRRDAVRATDELDAPLAGSTERRIDRVPTADVPPDRQGDGHLFLDDLTAALGGLNARQRDAILLRHQQGLTYPEIAAALGVREGTAKTLVHRGIEKLRRRLAGWRLEGADDGN